jgi:hypothetical protein
MLTRLRDLKSGGIHPLFDRERAGVGVLSLIACHAALFLHQRVFG